MSWAARRRLIILLVIGAVAVAFMSVVLISALYKTPSCSDGVQNQDESGVDCGGPCAYLCTAQQLTPTVLFTKTIQNASGRIDVIAKVENKNPNSAAKNVPYRVEIYDANQKVVKEVSGTVDLPPGATVPIYMPGILTAKKMVTHAFLTIDPLPIKWFAMNANTLNVPRVSTITQSGIVDSPRIDAILQNPDIVQLDTVGAIVFVHDINGEIIAASQTVVRSIPAGGNAIATFTWNSAFSTTTASIEVFPVVRLP